MKVQPAVSRTLEAKCCCIRVKHAVSSMLGQGCCTCSCRQTVSLQLMHEHCKPGVAEAAAGKTDLQGFLRWGLRQVWQ